MLNIRPVHEASRECEVSLNRLSSVIRIANNETSHHVHAIAMQAVYGFQGGIPMIPITSFRVLGCCTQELQVAFQNILDAQKNVSETRSPHQGCESFSLGGDGGSHGLHKIVQLVQLCLDDGVAQLLEAARV